MSLFRTLFVWCAAAWLAACAAPAARTPAATYDLVLRGGTIYDGSGGTPHVGDLAIEGDRIAFVGRPGSVRAEREIDVRGLAVAPGFINMLSWSTESLIEDGSSQSEIRQGVTLEVMGEGWSMGPLNDEMKVLALSRQADIRYPIEWTSPRPSPRASRPAGSRSGCGRPRSGIRSTSSAC